MKIGVLAVQGAFIEHVRTFSSIGVETVEVRQPEDLDGVAGLVLPGGESTALWRLMDGAPWLDALRAFHAEGGGLLGTCAGAILLAREVQPPQPSLGLLDAVVERNAYGRQTESFEAELAAPTFDAPMRGVFIRAPRLTATGPAVEILARLGGEPVLVRQGRVLAATFHPEMAADDRLHRCLLDQG